MALSRLERFKAAIKDDLDKIPNKPKEVVLPTPASRTEGPETEPTNDDNGEMSSSSNGNSKRRVKTGYQTRFENALNSLTIDTATANSDSEEDCEITIEPVEETESDTSVSKDSFKSPPSTKLGPKMRVAQVTLHGEAFCPILPVAKYPYKYVPKASSQAVASSFFDQGQFWAREWDLFYVWPREPADKPIIFVREEQFSQLLMEVGVKFPNLHIDPKDSYFRQIKLVTSFPDHPRFLPRYLGRSKSRDDHDKMVLRAPAQRPFAFSRDEPEPERAPTDEQVADFNDICETAIDLNRAKSKSKDKTREQKIAIQASLTKQLRRAQRYCGLRKHAVKGVEDPEVSFIPALDVTKPPIYEQELDVVIVCIDVEAWERSHSIITEVGVATLDTRDIKDVPPGPQGENWRSKIRARHLRIREHMTYVNHEFVQSAPDRFEKDFGTTEIISKKNAAGIVASCFKEPFSKPQTQEEIDASWEKLSKSSSDSDALAEETEKRNIVFLGHNPASDVSFLRTLGYDVTNLLNLIGFMDTAGLYRAHKKESNVRSLGSILSELGIVGWNLHNAGNDAVYTMWIMIAIIVAEAQVRDVEKDVIEDEEEKADEKVLEKAEGGKMAPKRVVLNVNDIVVPEDCYTW